MLLEQSVETIKSAWAIRPYTVASERLHVVAEPVRMCVYLKVPWTVYSPVGESMSDTVFSAIHRRP